MNDIFPNRWTPSLGTMKAAGQIMSHQFIHSHFIYLQIGRIFEFEFLKRMVFLYRNRSMVFLYRNRSWFSLYFCFQNKVDTGHSGELQWIPKITPAGPADSGWLAAPGRSACVSRAGNGENVGIHGSSPELPVPTLFWKQRYLLVWRKYVFVLNWILSRLKTNVTKIKPNFTQINLKFTGINSEFTEIKLNFTRIKSNVTRIKPNFT